MYIYFKPIITDRLIIRELTEQDTNDYFEFLANPLVAKYMLWSPYEKIEEVQSLIDRTIEQYKNKLMYRLGIELKTENKVIGFIGLSRYDYSPTTCQVVYGINQDYWGQKIMVEALEAFVEYLQEKENKSLIIATHVKENINSGKVLKKCGFKRDSKHDTIMNIKGTDELLIAYSIEKEVTNYEKNN